jgi:membrane-associated phospholipid phosphatase
VGSEAFPDLQVVPLPEQAIDEQKIDGSTFPTEGSQHLGGGGDSLVLPATDRTVSWKQMVPNLISDEHRMWAFPARLAQGKSWIPTVSILGSGAALQAVDPIEARYFRGSSTFQSFNNVFSSGATAIGTVVAPASLYAIGLARKDSKMTQTALFAGEAVANAEILSIFLKDATGRARPSDIPIGGNFSDSWFEGKGSRLSGKGSFPSGHAIAAFAVSTVVAKRYGNHRWVPYVSYGLAALVGFSRISLSAHFASDVFMGGAFGYSISRFVVLRQ